MSKSSMLVRLNLLLYFLNNVCAEEIHYSNESSAPIPKKIVRNVCVLRVFLVFAH